MLCALFCSATRLYRRWRRDSTGVSSNNLLKQQVNLIHLLEILGNESLGKYASNPRLRVQKCENVHKSLEFIKSRGIGLYNIGAEDIVDGNLKLILGLIWTLILRFTITDIKWVVSGASRRGDGIGG